MKLNESHRTAIIKALVDQKLSPKIKANEDAIKEIASAVYAGAFTAAERNQMNELPEGWLPEAETIKARLGGDDFGSKLPLTMPKKVRVPSSKYGYHGETAFLVAWDATHPVARRYSDLKLEKEQLEKERDELRRHIASVVRSASTANRLVTIWPEIREVVERIVKQPTQVNLPVVASVQLLNQKLGLIKTA